MKRRLDSSPSPSSSFPPRNRPRRSNSNSQLRAKPQETPPSTPSTACTNRYLSTSVSRPQAEQAQENFPPRGFQSLLDRHECGFESDSAPASIINAIPSSLPPRPPSKVTQNPISQINMTTLRQEEEYTIVDQISLRPLSGWSTRETFDKETLLYRKELVGISRNNVIVGKLNPLALGGMKGLKRELWRLFRSCGKILSIIVFNENKERYSYLGQIDFEDEQSALRALAIKYGYFHNSQWRDILISRRAYSQKTWRLAKESDLINLQELRLRSSQRNIKTPRTYEEEYGDQCPTIHTLPIRRDKVRPFSELGVEHKPPLLEYRKESQINHNESVKVSSSKRAEIQRKLETERQRMVKAVHPDLVGLLNHDWNQNDQICTQSEMEDEQFEAEPEDIDMEDFDDNYWWDYEDSEDWKKSVREKYQWIR
ncbi:uncharacterized protein IL334_005837 [Kwoniella shivajii]|uniref:RRM domain-containing protein n=1 Tax=Kwoniella shivajii TaxID=564305 RepID=A0ABZ1D7B5_9TREE|nr:hypothetical protein IL334_005837 [Kwoniella shivajii]